MEEGGWRMERLSVCLSIYLSVGVHFWGGAVRWVGEWMGDGRGREGMGFIWLVWLKGGGKGGGGERREGEERGKRGGRREGEEERGKKRGRRREGEVNNRK